jgi:hypothetical protein
MTTDEQNSFSGIGKKVLCIIFNLLVDRFPLNPDRVLVVLEASGNVRNLEDTKLFEKGLKKLSKDDLIDLIERYGLVNMSNVVNMVKPKELRELFTNGSERWKELEKQQILKFL